MASKIFQAKSFVSYWLNAVDEHSLHSPFFFDFYTRVLKPTKFRKGIERIEKLRNKLLGYKSIISAPNYGSGKPYNHSIASIAQNSLSPASYSELYARIIASFKCQHILELGTSFGINTLYLAQASNSTITTFEGSSQVAAIARLTFEFYGSKNIELHEGNIDVTLKNFLQTVRKVDFVLMDANHRLRPTTNYFELIVQKVHANSIVVVDDIHSSAEMEQAWNNLKNHDLVYGSADLFRCGILFFDPSLNKQHVILQY